MSVNFQKFPRITLTHSGMVLFIAILSGFILAFLWFLPLPFSRELGFPLDDAWIHLTYARHLWQEGRFAFNSGTFSTGATSPLWVLILACVYSLFGTKPIDALVVAVYGINILFFGGALWVQWQCLRLLTHHIWLSCLGIMLIAMSPIIVVTVFSGMEVNLIIFLLSLLLWDFYRKNDLRCGIWAGLAGLARPEAALVVLILFSFRLKEQLKFSQDKFSLSALSVGQCLAKWLSFSIILAAIWLSCNFYATGHCLPATFYVKHDTSILQLPNRVFRVFQQVFLNIVFMNNWFVVLLMLGCFLPKKSRSSHALFPIFFCGVGYLVAVCLNLAPDINSFYYVRYFIPAIPFFILAMFLGACQCSSWLCQHRQYLTFIVAAFFLLGNVWRFAWFNRQLHTDIIIINHVQKAAALWVSKNIKKNVWVAATDVGAMGYFSQHPILDVVGLNTPEILWEPQKFMEQHPVSAIFISLPGWYSVEKNILQVRKKFAPPNYIIGEQNDQHFIEQKLLLCPLDLRKPEPIRFFKKATQTFVRSFTIYCVGGAF